MIGRAGVVIGVAVLVCACAPRGFVRDGATYEEFAGDLRYCLDQVVPRWSPCQGRGACDELDAYIATQRNQCMQDLGWRITREDGRFVP